MPREWNEKEEENKENGMEKGKNRKYMVRYTLEQDWHLNTVKLPATAVVVE